MEFFVVKRIIGLSDVDLLPRILDPSHLVGHFGRLLYVFWVGQITIGPMRAVESPADPVQPDGLVGQLLCDFLGRENDGCCSVTWGAYVEPLDRRANWLRFHHVLDGDFCSKLSARVVQRVSLIFDGHFGNFLLFDSVLVHVTPHLQGEYPEKCRSERPLQYLVENTPKGVLRVRMQWRHFLLGNAKTSVVESGRDVPPSCNRSKYPCSTSHVDPLVRFSNSPRAIKKILAFHMDPVKRVRCGTFDNCVNVLEGKSSRV